MSVMKQFVPNGNFVIRNLSQCISRQFEGRTVIRRTYHHIQVPGINRGWTNRQQFIPVGLQNASLSFIFIHTVYCKQSQKEDRDDLKRKDEPKDTKESVLIETIEIGVFTAVDIALKVGYEVTVAPFRWLAKLGSEVNKAWNRGKEVRESAREEVRRSSKEEDQQSSTGTVAVLGESVEVCKKGIVSMTVEYYKKTYGFFEKICYDFMIWEDSKVNSKKNK